MKRVIFAICATGAIVLATVVPGQADGGSHRATVVKKSYCGLGMDATGFPEILENPTGGFEVTTPSGHDSLRCRFSFPAEWAPSHAQVNRGFECYLAQGQLATSSRVVLTPSGHAILTCKGKKAAA